MRRIWISVLALTCCGTDHAWVDFDADGAAEVGEPALTVADPEYPWDFDDCPDPEALCPEGWAQEFTPLSYVPDKWLVICSHACADGVVPECYDYIESCKDTYIFPEPGQPQLDPVCPPECGLIKVVMRRSTAECEGWSEQWAVSEDTECTTAARLATAKQ